MLQKEESVILPRERLEWRAQHPHGFACMQFIRRVCSGEHMVKTQRGMRVEASLSPHVFIPIIRLQKKHNTGLEWSHGKVQNPKSCWFPLHSPGSFSSPLKLWVLVISEWIKYVFKSGALWEITPKLAQCDPAEKCSTRKLLRQW